MKAGAEAAAAHLRLARTHYENFPVASILLPRRVRRPVAVMYAFARTADDLADEGDAAPAARLAALDAYVGCLDALRRGAPVEMPLFQALGAVIREHALPWEPFYALLSAFRQDVTQTRYRDFAELLDYCRRSANPVGRLLLCLFRADTSAHRAQSDDICTALQLINFLQDIPVDYTKGRIYLPLDEMRAHGVEAYHIAAAAQPPGWRALIQEQIVRARRMLAHGAPLARALPGRMGWELRMIVASAFVVLDKLERYNGQGAGSIRLSARDWVRIAGYVIGGLRSTTSTA